MKRWLTLFLAAMMCMTLVGCGNSKKIPLPFDVSEVKGIELYHYSVPTDAERKTLVYQHEIESIYNMLSGISIKDKKVEPLTGTSTTIFSFTLTDDTIYNVTYCFGDITYGTVNLSNDETTWYTSTNMESLWYASDVDSTSIETSELPAAN